MNLLRILSATRFRILTKGKLYRAKCPKTYCYSRDSLRHLLECYELTRWVEYGTEGAQFLVRMARVSLAPEGQQLIPYLQVFEPEMAVA